MKLRRLFSFCFVLCLLRQSVFAAYDHPVSWGEMNTPNLDSVLRSRYASRGNLLEPAVSSFTTERVLNDLDGRIESAFRIPLELTPSVRFWLRIYTELTTQHVVLFDRRHPDIIYGVLDFRELAKKARNRAAYEIMVENKTKAALNSLKTAFARLIHNPRIRKNPGPMEKQILTAISKTKHQHKLSFFLRNIRTQTGQRDNIIKGLLAAEIFFPKMEQIFSSFGLPPELTRLSLVESSFNPKAVSYAGATGVWQFMLTSGHEFLQIDTHLGIDERLSPLKSTVAAAKLLKRNFRILKTWPLAITSYNHGFKHLRRLAGAGLFDPCSKTSRLGWASRNYYSEFLAVLYAERYRDVFYGPIPKQYNQSVGFYRLEKSDSAISIALNKSIALQEFKFLNPDIKNIHRKLPRGFLVVTPIQSH